MKVPSFIKQWANKHDLIVTKVIYRHKNTHYTGWDICKPNGQVIVGLEKVLYPSGIRWFIKFVHINYKGPRFFHRLTKNMFIHIDPSQRSNFINKEIKDEYNKST